jgi:hypothetical protein
MAIPPPVSVQKPRGAWSNASLSSFAAGSTSSSSSSRASSPATPQGSQPGKSHVQGGKRPRRQKGGKTQALEEEIKNLRAQTSAQAVADREKQQVKKDAEDLERAQQRAFETAVKEVPDIKDLTRYETAHPEKLTFWSRSWYKFCYLCQWLLLLCLAAVMVVLVGFSDSLAVDAVVLFAGYHCIFGWWSVMGLHKPSCRIQSYSYVVGDELVAPTGAQNSSRFAKLEVVHRDPRIFIVDYVRAGYVRREDPSGVVEPTETWETSHKRLFVSAALVAECCDKFMIRPWTADTFTVVMDDICSNSSINLPLARPTVRADTLLYIRDTIMQRQSRLSGSQRLFSDGFRTSRVADSSFQACPSNL